MGYSSYSFDDRSYRSVSRGYASKSRDEIFTQNAAKRAHDEMNPRNITLRECRDSEEHPNVIPIQLYLDLTGSMGHIPHEMIKDGLPTLMSKLIQNGVKDPSLMFGGIGDHECDRFPLQVAQFESGDAELDMWLERTYIEGGGGGNAGESYHLAWFFSNNYVVTDAFQKRNKKGYIFTIGDEPVLRNLPGSAIESITGKAGETVSAEFLLSEARKKNYVIHIFLEHGTRKCDSNWKSLMVDELIILKDYREIPNVIANIILEKEKSSFQNYEGQGEPVSNNLDPAEDFSPKENFSDILLSSLGKISL